MKNLWKKWIFIAQFHFQDPDSEYRSGSSLAIWIWIHPDPVPDPKHCLPVPYAFEPERMLLFKHISDSDGGPLPGFAFISPLTQSQATRNGKIYILVRYRIDSALKGLWHQIWFNDKEYYMCIFLVTSDGFIFYIAWIPFFKFLNEVLIILKQIHL